MEHQVIPGGVQAAHGGGGAVYGVGQGGTVPLLDDRDDLDQRVEADLAFFEHLVELFGVHVQRVGEHLEHAGRAFPEL